MINCLGLKDFIPTGVGSLPYKDPKQACDIVFKYFSPGIPFWPQLPRRSFEENMYVQYSEALPGVRIDQARKRIYVDTQAKDYEAALEKLYEEYLKSLSTANYDFFKISEAYASGFYEFIRNSAHLSKSPYLKGQIIGPISFGFSVCDQDKKAIVYNEEFRDCLSKRLSMNALWQIGRLRTINPEAKIIIFIDEPYLVSIGSSFFNISTQKVIAILDEIIKMIHKENAFAGIHCCGNTDWSIITQTDIDIINFDAYNYMEGFLAYRSCAEAFLKKGGVLAFGIAPTDIGNDLPDESLLLERIKSAAICSYGLITPACGLGSTNIERAQSILELLRKLGDRVLHNK